MTSLFCPQCSAENSSSAMNCERCGINLKFALEHPEALVQADQKDLALQSSPLTSDLQHQSVMEAEEALRATTLPPNLLRARKWAVLAWAIALPLGWLPGWAIGAAIAYNRYIPQESIPQDRIQAWREEAAASGGWLGGMAGILIGWIMASVITLMALRVVIPALKPSQIVLAAIGATLPVVLMWLIIGSL